MRIRHIVHAVLLIPLAVGSAYAQNQGRPPTRPTTSTAAPAGPTRPTVTVPVGPRPTTLQIIDQRMGTGAEVRSGMTVHVHYVGVAWSTGTTFDESWSRGETFSFRVGGGMVIPGWDTGLVGMRVGGRRQLIIPPAMGYGARGAGASIGPNETLIFVIDLVRAE